MSRGNFYLFLTQDVFPDSQIIGISFDLPIVSNMIMVQIEQTMWRTGTLQPRLQDKNVQEQNLNFEAEIKTHSEEWARCLKSNELPPAWVGWPHCHQNSRMSQFNQIFHRDDEDTEETERGGGNIYCSLGIFILIKIILKREDTVTALYEKAQPYSWNAAASALFFSFLLKVLPPSKNYSTYDISHIFIVLALYARMGHHEFALFECHSS